MLMPPSYIDFAATALASLILSQRPRKSSDIVVYLRLGPVPSQHGPALLVTLDLPDDLMARTLQPEVEAADPAE
jgi:hypothetical protein